MGDWQPNADAPSAMRDLTARLQEDPGYAWSWQCNLAVPIMDVTGVSHEQANQAAAHLMQHLFDIDITKHKSWPGYPKAPAQEYAELRIAAEREEDHERENARG